VLKSHIPSSADADVAKLVAHAMAKAGNFGREKKSMSITQHRMLLCTRQLVSYRHSTARCHQWLSEANVARYYLLMRGSVFVSQAHLGVAIAASDMMTTKTIVISSKVDISYASAFGAGLIALLDRKPNSEVTKECDGFFELMGPIA
jgi:hypothetical protein